jgi:hypothetical protein
MTRKNAKNGRSVAEAIDGLLDYVESADYAGYDPYDALNSPLIRLVGRKSKWVRIACTQFLRHCPVNLRPVLGIRKEHNPKGIGLFLWGYSKLYALTKEPRYRERVDYLFSMLERLQSKGCSGHCWGYNFDWQSRTCFRPKGVPTIVNSAFIGHALLDCYECTGLQRALDLAIPIQDFILNDLHRTRDGDSFCFSYTPMDTDMVHNANMLGASILIRLARHCGAGNGIDAALSGLAYSMRRQNEDGSWYYGEHESQRWIDSFHTGFNVQALRYILGEGYAREYAPAYEKGVKFYAEHFFLADGTPKYFHDRTYPIDIHAPAQAICFFAGQGREYRDLADRIVTWMLESMYSGRGFFYFRKGKFLTNRVPYMRWSQAWAFHALTEYLLTAQRGELLSRSWSTKPESYPVGE